jgi:K(+)-stimulated pyrophosphate-energized sodium pump
MGFAYAAVIGSGLLALLFGIWLIRRVLSHSAGNEEMQRIAAAIQEGARAYLNRQYQAIALVGVVVCAILTYFLNR